MCELCKHPRGMEAECGVCSEDSECPLEHTMCHSVGMLPLTFVLQYSNPNAKGIPISADPRYFVDSATDKVEDDDISAAFSMSSVYMGEGRQGKRKG